MVRTARSPPLYLYHVSFRLQGGILSIRSTRRGMVTQSSWRMLPRLRYTTWTENCMSYSSQAHDAMRVLTLRCHRIAVGKAEWPLYEGRTFNVSSKEIELERPLKKSEYLSGQCFGASDYATSSTSATRNKAGLSRQFAPLKINYPLAARPGVPEGEQVILVRPGDLLSAAQASFEQKEHQGSADGGSHWTANWYAPLSSVLVVFCSTCYRRKQQIKKHKTWDGDAYVSIFGEKLIMVSEEGKL